MSWQEVAEAFRTSWHHVFCSVEMAVIWGRERQDLSGNRSIGIDEIQWQKGHKYLTVVYQIDQIAAQMPGAYVYSVDRTQNLPFGDEFVFPDFTIPIGEWFQAKMRLTTNSSLDTNDGQIQVWLNDKLLFERSGIQWQSKGHQLLIDQVLNSSFHGGNTSQWSLQDVV